MSNSGANFEEISGSGEKLNRLPVHASVTTSITLSINEAFPCNATSGELTETLPTPKAIGNLIYVEKEDSSTNYVTVKGTIRGVSNSTDSLKMKREGVLYEAESLSSWRPIGDRKTLGSLDERYEAKIAETISGLVGHENVYLATAEALPANTYLSGVLTGAAFGALSVDGTAVVVGKRLIVKNEVAAANNGIYTVTHAGGVAELYALTRATDMNTGGGVEKAYAFVEAGAINKNAGFFVSAPGPFTVGTTAIPWSKLPGTGDTTAGTGIEIVGNKISTSSVVPTNVSGGPLNSTNNKSPIYWTGGTTVRNRDWDHVKDFGAKCDNSTNDTVAVQEAVTDVLSRKVGHLKISGICCVSTVTAAGNVIEIPERRPLEIIGVGHAAETEPLSIIETPTLKALDSSISSHYLISGAGTSITNRGYPSIKNLFIDGNTFVNGLNATRANEALHKEVFYYRCPKAIVGVELFNSVISGCRFFKCGTGGVPVIEFGAVETDSFEGGANTVILMENMWENCYGPSAIFSGNLTAEAPIVAIYAMGCKTESYNWDGPFFDFPYASGVMLSGGMIARTKLETGFQHDSEYAEGEVGPLIRFKNATSYTKLSSNQIQNLTLIDRNESKYMLDVTDKNANVIIDNINLDSATVLNAGIHIGFEVEGAIDIGTVKRRGNKLGSAGTIPAVLDERISGVSRSTYDKTPTGGPWRHSIIPLLAPQGSVSHSGTWSYQNVTTAMNNGYTGNGGVQNEYLGYDIWFDQGTWEITTVGKSGTSRGKCCVILNETTVCEQDYYAASAAENVILHNSFTVSKSALYRTLFKGATKNASSSGYALLLSQMEFVRIA